jgi:hypothetical protein
MKKLVFLIAAFPTLSFAASETCFDFHKEGAFVEIALASPAWGGPSRVVPLNEPTEDFLGTIPPSGKLCVKGSLVINGQGATYFVYSARLAGN